MMWQSIYAGSTAFIILSLTVACGEGGGATETTTIDQDGGLVESDDGRVRLDFPQGAVEGETLVTIQEQPSSDRDDVVTGVYTFELDGELLASVGVEIDVVEEPPGDAIVVLARYGDGEPQSVTGSGLDPSGEMVVGELSQFSSFVGWAMSSDVAPEDFELEMLTDLHPEGEADPMELTSAGDHLFFTATDPEHTGISTNALVYMSDGTGAGTAPLDVYDNHPTGGTWATGRPEQLTEAGGQLFFEDNGSLWVVHEEAAERELILIEPEGASLATSVQLNPAQLAAFDGRLFFSASANDEGSPRDVGRELWVSDGTSEGTYVVKDINPGGDSNPGRDDGGFTEAGGELFFTAEHDDYGRELWATDGTEGGTRLVKDIRPGGSSTPRHLTEFDGKLYFGAAGPEQDYELWVSDGTEEGTGLLKKISYDDAEELWGSFPQRFMEYDGKLYFSAQPTGLTPDSEMWVTDGTEEGTRRFHDVNPYGYHAVHNGRLFFAGRHDDDGQELWVTDGTEAGTRLVKNVNPAESSGADHVTSTGDALYFRADDGDSGDQLWVSDGSGAAGTV